MENLHTNNYLFSNRNLLKLILPLMFEQLLAVTVGLADSIMVASVGESAVSAISLVDTVMILILNVFAALATGGAVVSGQFIGQKNNNKACKSGEQLIVLITLISVVVMVLMYFGRVFILDTLFGKIEPDVREYSTIYMNIVFASIPFIALYNSGAALFRSMGNSKITLITSIIMNIINVAGNAILIYGFKMDVEGAAIPTLISRVAGAFIIIGLLFNKNLIIHLTKKFSFKLEKYTVRNILNIAIPSSIENSMFQLGKILLLSLVAGFGTASITANAVGGTISSFEVLPGAAIGLGLITVISRCVGAGDFEQVRYYTKKLLKFTYISLLVINIALFISLPFIIDIYNLSDETAKMARQVIIFHGICSCLIWPLSFTLPNTLRAASDVKYTMIIGVASMWICRIGFGIIFAKYLGLGMFGVWVAMIIDWIARSIFFVFRYRGTRWNKIKLKHSLNS